METYDLVIKNARIIDGTGGPWFRGDVCVKGGSIVSIGKCKDKDNVCANHVIDAQDKVLAPGFIDIHGHYELFLLNDPAPLTALRQGVTTNVISQCGFSPAPVREDKIELIDLHTGFIKGGADVKWNWRSFGDYMEVLDNIGLGINIASFVGQGTIRLNVMGNRSCKPTKKELEDMRALADEALNDGAFGISTGLVYPPGVYTDTDEIIEIAKMLKKCNGLYISHIRSETNKVVEAVNEIINIAERAEVPAQVAHLKAGGKNNWGKVHEAVRMLEEARERGTDITVDQYPYSSASTTLRAILPPWAQIGSVENVIERLTDPRLRAKIAREVLNDESYENFFKHSGGPEGVVILNTPETPEYEGENLYNISNIMRKEPIDAAFDIIIKNKGYDNACYIMMNEDDVKYVLKQPLVMIGSDSLPALPNAKVHPRTTGTFPRVLGKYVRQEKTVSLEEAIWKMTGFPASRLNLPNKGLIKVGMDADLVVFDPDTVIDGSDFKDPFKEPEGIDYVIVNGKIVMNKGKFTGVRAGKTIKRKSY